MWGKTNAIGGGSSNYYGLGGDGTPDFTLDSKTTAPNGGNISYLWNMNTSLAFTTNALTSASDSIIFQIDFGAAEVLSNTPILATTAYPLYLHNVSISTGVARELRVETSDNGTTWTDRGALSATVSTSASAKYASFSNITARYMRLIIKAGGSTCTLTIQTAGVNISNAETTALYFRKLYAATLNSGAVIKEYMQLTVPNGVELTTQNPCQGLILYSLSDVVINGKINMTEKGGLSRSTVPFIQIINVKMLKNTTLSTSDEAFPVGGSGGAGGGSYDNTSATKILAPGGAGTPGRKLAGGYGGGGAGGGVYVLSSNSGGYGGASNIESTVESPAAASATRTATNTGAWFQNGGNSGSNGGGGSGAVALYNNSVLTTAKSGVGGIRYGSGGGGSGAYFNTTTTTTATGSAGGNGKYAGGFICLIVKGNLTLASTSVLTVNGGAGGTGGPGGGAIGDGSTATGGGGGGGGAGGGVIMLLRSGTYSGLGVIQANGGSGGSGGSGGDGGPSGISGTAGSVGVILTKQIV